MEHQFYPHVVEDFDPTLVTFPVAAEPKYNGWRCIISIDQTTGHATARTRTGLDITSHVGHIINYLVTASQVTTPPLNNMPVVFDGELIHHRGPREIISICSQKSHARDDRLLFAAFDLPCRPGTYLERTKILASMLERMETEKPMIPTYALHSRGRIIESADELKEYYREFMNNISRSNHATTQAPYLGISDLYEGLVVKVPYSYYGHPGSWMRLKPGICPWSS